MKKIVLALLCVLVALCTAGLVACGGDDTVNEIVFKTLTVNDREISATVSNATDSFDFSQEIEKKGKAGFILSTDAEASSVIENTTVNLSVGENVFYITLTVGGEKTETVYTLKIKRLAMYTVTFDTDGGTAVEAQTVEEGSLATAPTTTKFCYDFAGWDYDFTKPITANKTITASWMEKADIAAFTFNIVGETCTITGLKESAEKIAISDISSARLIMNRTHRGFPPH